MAELLTDDLGRPIPQYQNAAGTAFEALKGANNALKDMSDDGAHETLGALADAAVTDPAASASVVAALKGVLTDLGQIADALVAAGATGSVSAKLRRLTTDLDSLLTKTGEVQATPTANTVLARLKTVGDGIGTTASAAVTDPASSADIIAGIKGLLTDIGQITDALVDAGATGSVSAKLRRLTTDLDAINTTAATLATEATVATLATEATAATLATESTLASQLNITISALRDALAGVAPATVGDLGLILDQLDVALSTIASEATAATLATEATLAAQLDVVLSTRAADATLTDGSQLAQPYSSRDAGTLHRNAITSVDKLADFGGADVTLADNGAGTGSLNNNTAYYVTAIPGNRWGNCKVNTNIDTLTTAASGLDTHSIRATIAQRTGADYYDLFLSTDTAPKWVARVTEAQRAAGDYEVTAVGTVAAGGGNPAGTIDINVAGTGQRTSAANFANNNAYTPASVTPIDCTGKSKAHVLVKVALTDLRSVPTLRLIPFFANQVSANDWHQGEIETAYLLGALGQSLEQDFTVSVDGSTGMVVLVDTISGQGAAASVWVELV